MATMQDRILAMYRMVYAMQHGWVFGDLHPPTQAGGLCSMTYAPPHGGGEPSVAEIHAPPLTGGDWLTALLDEVGAPVVDVDAP